MANAGALAGAGGAGTMGLGTALGALTSVGGFLTGSKANKKAEAARQAALARARGEITQGYDAAGNLITPAYDSAIAQKGQIAGQIGEQGQATYDAQKELWAPWMVPGINAYKQMDTLINDPNGYNTVFQQYTQSPEFKFKMDNATQQIRRQASAAGNRFGGAQTAALSDRAQSVAGDAFNSWLDRLQTMANTGFQATGQMNNAATALGQTKIGALEYGDTGNLAINKGTALGNLATAKSQDLANLTIGQGGVSANSALAMGALQQNLLQQIGQLGGAAMGGMGGGGGGFGSGGGLSAGSTPMNVGALA